MLWKLGLVLVRRPHLKSALACDLGLLRSLGNFHDMIVRDIRKPIILIMMRIRFISPSCKSPSYA